MKVCETVKVPDGQIHRNVMHLAKIPMVEEL